MHERVGNSLFLTLATKCERMKSLSLSILVTALSHTDEFLEPAKSSSTCKERSCWADRGLQM